MVIINDYNLKWFILIVSHAWSMVVDRVESGRWKNGQNMVRSYA